MPGDPMSAAAVQVGFFGKIPCRGDFVQAGLSRRFTRAWDDWVQAVLPACQQRFGEAWDSVWRAAPSWRFALPGGQCGAVPVLGLVLPSEDGAGRRFPLMIAAEGADDGVDFLDAAEAVGWDAVCGGLPPDRLLLQLTAIAPPPAAAAAECVSMRSGGPTAGGPMGNSAMGRWWSGPGSAAGDVVISLAALPDAAAFAGMLHP
jgi:type VI secretion system protein ImpM